MERFGTAELIPQITEILKNAGIEYVISDQTEDSVLYQSCDVVLTVGGDGTLIKHAKAAAVYGTPCLGINTGRLGFLANLEREQIELLKNLATGEYTVESRMMLSVKLFSKDKVLYEGIALNDAVVSSGIVAKITDLSLNVSGDEISYLSDGIIISTPTGSTAYSMSAGGPIIDHNMRCITVTPICSHSLTARPILSHESAVMTVSLRDTSRTGAYLTVDGNRAGELDFSTKAIVCAADIDAKFVNLSQNTIYKTISKKF
jgi:NAD+ kinase